MYNNIVVYGEKFEGNNVYKTGPYISPGFGSGPRFLLGDKDQDLALNSIGIRLRSRIFDIETDPIQVGDPASLHIFFCYKS